MNDGSRHFAELNFISFFETMRQHLRELDGAVETGFVSDGVTEMWLEFDYLGYRFSISNQLGWYWFFVSGPACPDRILSRVVDHFAIVNPRTKRIAFYGGTFDPVHRAHLGVAKAVTELFRLDEFFFLPAFHAPHKPDSMPTSAYHRYAMLCLATADDSAIAVSTIEIEHGKSRYSFDTLEELNSLFPGDRIFFVMGADSWSDILTWHRWEEVLLMSDHIVISRPGYEIGFDHVTGHVRERIVDLRGGRKVPLNDKGPSIFITDAVNMDISATEIRQDVLEDDVLDRTDDVPAEVAKYIEKYELYK